jgi:serine/threonine-protein kinase
MASVYLAHDPALDREVAIKTLNAGAHNKYARLFEENFINEARAVARLNYPNIVTVYEAGRADGYAYIAMEHLEGQDLRQLLWNDTRLSYVHICDLLLRVARALDYAHKHGVVHRDVKPANIFLLRKNRPKILDFGLAQLPANLPIEPAEHPYNSQIAGTPYYMSPEQVMGKALDGRSDIFSLGVILYELLTQRKPFDAKRPPAVLEQILHKAPPLPHELRSSVPHELELVVARALAKDPAKRYQSAYDLARDLGRFSAKARAQRLLEHAQAQARQHSRVFVSQNQRPDQAAGTRPAWFKFGGHWLDGWFGGTTQTMR